MPLQGENQEWCVIRRHDNAEALKSSKGFQKKDLASGQLMALTGMGEGEELQVLMSEEPVGGLLTNLNELKSTSPRGRQ